MWKRQAWQVGLAFSFLQMEQFSICFLYQVENLFPFGSQSARGNQWDAYLRFVLPS
jgi:hypothetical protein